MPAPAGRAADPLDDHSQAQSNGCEHSCTGAALRAYERAAVVRQAPDRLWTEQQRRLREDAGNSAILDSRITFWCDRLGTNEKLYRDALHHGYTVRWSEHVRGRFTVRHTIRPDELK